MSKLSIEISVDVQIGGGTIADRVKFEINDRAYSISLSEIRAVVALLDHKIREESFRIKVDPPKPEIPVACVARIGKKRKRK